MEGEIENSEIKDEMEKNFEEKIEEEKEEEIKENEKEEKEEKRTDGKSLIEALLFMAARPVSINELIKAASLNAHEIKEIINCLNEEYKKRDSWIEIVAVGKSYFMRINPKYNEAISGFVQEVELSKRALRVLALVVNNKEILQSKVVKILGPVYDAIKELEDKKYIISEKKGHTKLLRLSERCKFYLEEKK
jgi:segregation and condensation protein B